MKFRIWFENDRYSTPDKFLGDRGSVTFLYTDKLYFGNERDKIVTHADLVRVTLELKRRYGIPDGMRDTEEIYNRLQYDDLFGTDLGGRVSMDAIEWEGKAKKRQVVSLWNDSVADYKHFDSLIRELMNKKVINDQTFITSPLVGSVPIEVARDKLFKSRGIDPEEAMKLDLRRRLHMMTGLEKQNAMKKLGTY